ncbi:MAG: hypothetical protein K6T71_02555 [Candidatus Bipolaricaulota bacterium]|nr:hypothetical protein [Candidatus Bipolaricaulota bacterium]
MTLKTLGRIVLVAGLLALLGNSIGLPPPAVRSTALGQPVAPVADYGDAPDNLPCGYSEDPATDITCKFPTLFGTTNSRVTGRPGAHTLTLGQESLGALELTSTERDVNDPNDLDQTPNLVDDDIDDGLRVALLPTGLIRFTVLVRIAPTAPPGPRYLNALYDRNRDGEWKTSDTGDEWIVKNQMITLSPGEEQEIEIPIPVDQNWIVALAQPRWLRLAFTREPIPEAIFIGVGGWDGSGQFSAGEIEDYKIGAARAYDLAWAARSSFRVAWAWAQAQARSFALAMATAQAQVEAMARAEASALAVAQAAASAEASARASASAAVGTYTHAQVQAAAAVTQVMALPCAVVTASARASIDAALRAIAQAQAAASASAQAAAEASARALAWARAISEALARARAAATALAAAGAQAEARARALAVSWADARAWATALAQTIGQAPAQASALALAWAQAQAWAYAWAEAQASASAWALAYAHAQAIAAAQARAEAAALAVAEAEAAARAAASAAASASASASVALRAIASVAAAINVQTITDCCRTAGYCQPPPPEEQVLLTVKAAQEDEEMLRELTGVPITLTAAGATTTTATPFTRTLPRGTTIRVLAPAEWAGLRFSHWLLHDGRTFTSNPLDATIVSPTVTLTAIYKRVPVTEYTLTVESNCPNAAITVTPPGRTVAGQPPSTFRFSHMQEIRLSASPTLSACGMLPTVHRFKEWRMDGLAAANPFTFRITGNTRAIAYYEPATAENRPPVAVLSCPRSAEVNKPFTCDGSRSYDPDGRVTQWWWQATCPDIGHSFIQGGPTHTVTCGKAGTATIELYVVDDKGAKSAIVKATVSIR